MPDVSIYKSAVGEKEAPPLILLHGSCSNALSFMGDVPEYSRSFRVYAVDIPGEAGKSSPNRPGWNCPAFAEWMEDLFSGLGIHKQHCWESPWEDGQPLNMPFTGRRVWRSWFCLPREA